MASVAEIARWFRQASRLEDDQHKQKRLIYRRGKTARDRSRGAQQQAYENRMARVGWQHDTTGRTPFPKQACNGKRNRYCWTGKKGVTVFAASK